MIDKILLLFNTVKYLKPIQVYYQLKYRIQKAGSLATYNKTYFDDGVCFLSFKKQPPVYRSYLGKNEFSFLNLPVNFNSDINWNYQEHGKLWNYNLQYGNYLLQEDISVDERKVLISSLYETLDDGRLDLEPYPVSLRSINCIRFLSHHKIEEPNLYSFLHGELDFLSKRPEYHLLGNHLVENAFALITGGAFFSNEGWLAQGQQILEKQLDEQIMEDGAHFELSPMYHQIIYFRLLELIDWYTNWANKENRFLISLMDKAEMMRFWLSEISCENGDIPHFNDSAEGIAYSTPWLLDYSRKLEIAKSKKVLGDSGYRTYKNGSYECKVDVAQVGPSYQPGHAHADALSFILYYKNEPLFVEVGTSTYQINEVRAEERGTSSHNTVVINDSNQSNVWSGFRVAQRAKTEINEDRTNYLVAQHDGYKKLGIIHRRAFEFKNDSILIIDNVNGNAKTKNQFHLHLHPSVKIEAHSNDSVSLFDKGSINFVGAKSVEVLDYDMADGYNRYKLGKKIVVTFEKSLETIITFN